MVTFAQVSTVQQFLVSLLNFINVTLIPFLFTLGFVFFLFNVVRYFVITPEDSAAKEKARTFAFYSIAALVLAVIIWGIVNLFASNLFRSSNTDYVCPDWLERFNACSLTSSQWPNYGPPSGGSNTTAGGQIGGTECIGYEAGRCVTNINQFSPARREAFIRNNPSQCIGYEAGRCITDISQFSPARREAFILNNPSLNDGISNPTILDRNNPTFFDDLPEELKERCVRLNIADENCNENVRAIDLVDGDDEFDSEFNDSPIEDSALALLLYGSERELVRQQSNDSLPGARNQVVQISENASCRDGLTELQSAAGNDPSSASYLLYRDSSGQTKWTNLTDDSTSRSIVIDADQIATIKATGASDLHIVHTHQKRSVSGIPLTALGPSTADLTQICNNSYSDTTQLYVDWTGVWVAKTTSVTCPLTSSDRENFGLAVGTNALAHLPSGLRDTELVKLINSPIVPDADVSYYQSLINDRLTEISTVEIRNLARNLLLDSSISLGRTGPVSFCSEEF